MTLIPTLSRVGLSSFVGNQKDFIPYQELVYSIGI
jgi:hypothetical protein